MKLLTVFKIYFYCLEEITDDDLGIPPEWIHYVPLSGSEGMGEFNPTSDFLHGGMEDLDVGDAAKGPVEAQGNINVALSVKCDETKMVASIEKDSLQVRNLDIQFNWFICKCGNLKKVLHLKNYDVTQVMVYLF